MFFSVSTTDAKPIVIDLTDCDDEDPSTASSSNDGDLFIIEQKGGSAIEKSLEQIHLLPRTPSNNITDFMNKIECRLRGESRN